MRSKILLSITVIALVILIILFNSQNASNFKVINHKKVYSYLYTDETEEYFLYFLVNKDSYHVDLNYIDDAKIVDGDKIINININKIYISEDSKIYNDEHYYEVAFEYELDIYLHDTILHLNNALLHISYVNGEYIEFELGEYILAYKEVNDVISIHEIIQTTSTVNDYTYVDGLYLELSTVEPIRITDITLHSNQVKVSLKDIIELEDVIELHSAQVDILGYEIENITNSSFQYNLVDTNCIYIPFYNKEHMLLERFFIEITYIQNDIEHKVYFDDLPFVNNNLYKKTESDFVYYEFNN